MDQAQTKMELFKKGYNCGQIIAALLGDVCGLDRQVAFSGMVGMCDSCGPNCSTLRGGAQCIGLYCRGNATDCASAKERAEKMIAALNSAFQNKHGSLLCSDLRKGDMMACAGYVDTVVDAVTELVQQDQAAQTVT